MCRRELPQGGAGGALRSGYILHAAGHSPLHILSTFGTWPCNGSESGSNVGEVLNKKPNVVGLLKFLVLLVLNFLVLLL